MKRVVRTRRRVVRWGTGGSRGRVYAGGNSSRGDIVDDGGHPGMGKRRGRDAEVVVSGWMERRGGRGQRRKMIIYMDLLKTICRESERRGKGRRRRGEVGGKKKVKAVLVVMTPLFGGVGEKKRGRGGGVEEEGQRWLREKMEMEEEEEEEEGEEEEKSGGEKWGKKRERGKTMMLGSC